jgi:hypothetical protein
MVRVERMTIPLGTGMRAAGSKAELHLTNNVCVAKVAAKQFSANRLGP